MSQVYRLLGNWGVFVLLGLLVGLPIYGPALAWVESTYWPVASKLTIDEAVEDSTGVKVRYHYQKLRSSCEYLGGYAKRGVNELPHEALGGDDPKTIGVGVNITRYWHIDTSGMNGVEVWFTYRCHFLWILAQKVYP